QEDQVRAGNRQRQREAEAEQRDREPDEPRRDRALPAPPGRGGEPPRALREQPQHAVEHGHRERTPTRASRQPRPSSAERELDPDERDREPERGREPDERDGDQRERADEEAEARLGGLVDDLADRDARGAVPGILFGTVASAELAEQLVHAQAAR